MTPSGPQESRYSNDHRCPKTKVGNRATSSIEIPQHITHYEATKVKILTLAPGALKLNVFATPVNVLICGTTGLALLGVLLWFQVPESVWRVPVLATVLNGRLNVN